MTHVPPLHFACACSIEQALLQEPQLLTLVSVFTSQPSIGLPLQSAQPMLQAAMPQVREAHFAVPFLTVQALPHVPQFRTSLLGLAHCELQQFQPPEQAAPQPPQLRGSIVVFAQLLPQQVSEPGQPCWALQPSTQLSAMQTLPSGQSPSWRQITQTWVRVSQ